MQKVVIMTALSDERKAVMRYLTNVGEDVHPTSGTIYRKGLFTSEKGQWEVVVVLMGMGNVNAAHGTQQAIDYLSPDLLFFVGIAGGLKDVSPGDVVAANKIYQYASGKAGASFLPRAEVRLSAHSLVQRAQTVAEDEEWQKRVHPQPFVFPKAYIGAIAAGEQVLTSTDSETWKLLQNNYSDALAAEMEGYGFLASAYVNRGVEAIVIRGISDTLDNKTTLDKHGFQYTAACHASAFAFEMLTWLSAASKGKVSLEQGALALERKDYRLARSHLNNAIQEISNSDKRLAAKARYLQALAVLRDELPRDKGLVVREKVDKLLNMAFELDECRAYLLTMMYMKRDIFEHNPSRKHQEEVSTWQKKANSVPNMDYDDELLVYLKHCQPRLYYQQGLKIITKTRDCQN